ncbi:TrkH family potassium uptake protein [Arhodomonas sp. AD133]|uniref:TrkH family potassium uptake protein n=1 Tax=Arhodomonas sp. AD133 TaxID=3415009 RepID=UPI003EB8206C
MKWAVIQRLIGLLLMLFSVTALPPVVVSLLTDDGQAGVFGATFALTLATGLALWMPVRNFQGELRTRDGFLVVALFWTVLGLFGAVPFMLGPHLDLTDAVFEAVSGFTTTGATVIIGLDGLPPSVLYHRQQLQWLGGLGVIVLAVAIIPMLGVGGMQLYRAETPGPMKDDKLTPRIMHTARTLWYVYLGLTVVCAVAYWWTGMTVFDAIAHSFSTIATGGYSPHDASLGYYDSFAVETVANVFMLLGGVNFAMHFLVWRGRDPRYYWRDTETRAYLVLIVAFAALIAATLWLTGAYTSAGESMRDAVFHVISIITTTGYTTAGFAQWPLYIPLLIAAIGFIGGCAGSTAGGMKVVRIVLLYKQGVHESFLLIHPRAKMPVKLGNKPVPESVMNSVWGFYTLYVLSSLVLTALMMAAGLDLESAFGAVMATINLVGPGLGTVASNFADVPEFVKWLAVFAMLLGRLEVFTLLVLFTPAFWRH